MYNTPTIGSDYYIKKAIGDDLIFSIGINSPVIITNAVLTLNIYTDFNMNETVLTHTFDLIIDDDFNAHIENEIVELSNVPTGRYYYKMILSTPDFQQTLINGEYFDVAK